MDAQTLMNITQQLAVGLLDSCKIFFLTLLFSMPLGLLVTFGRMSKWAPLKFLAPQTLIEKLKLAQSAEGKAENLPMGTRFAGGFFFFKPIDHQSIHRHSAWHTPDAAALCRILRPLLPLRYSHHQ